jgi:hypothetical protein
MNSNYTKVRIDKRNGLESEVKAEAASTVDFTESVYKHTVAEHFDEETCNEFRDDLLQVVLERIERVAPINTIMACIHLVGLLVLSIPDLELRIWYAKLVTKISEGWALAAESLPLATEDFEASDK